MHAKRSDMADADHPSNSQDQSRDSPQEPVIIGRLKPRRPAGNKEPSPTDQTPDEKPAVANEAPAAAGSEPGTAEGTHPANVEEKGGTPPSGEASPAGHPAAKDPAEEAGQPSEPEPMDTLPVDLGGTKLDQAPEEGKLYEACPACGTLMDVTAEEPFARIHCPSCGQALRARKQFNHYKLLELIGQGGMGNVFKAEDCNLKRMVALKVLKKELAGSPEERAKLAEESRITASIHHPHVVKVYSFGEDHGQFYMAMELVENKSLDELLVLQRRVPEAQVLEVGIQIAEGLQAAHEKGLIHRDLKPGNILFADAHTAKLVDFGLAIVADEAAAASGEIWGTPYYIAPEKLDNQPEDFRSDIYSLGGTMFHALAGRPPYEADTASMVALKQLKSQPISLQSFAPDVSSETAYVVNRMLAKNADDRYNSYDELIEHLSYVRTKLIERTQKPPQPRKRVVLETKQTRTFTALISLILLAVVVTAGIAVYVFRGDLFDVAAAQASAFVAKDFDRDFDAAVKNAAAMRFEEARAGFEALAAMPNVPQPRLNWARMNAALAALLSGDAEAAATEFDRINKEGLYATEGSDLALANFFVEATKLLARKDTPIDPRTASFYSRSNAEAFGLLAFALHDWQLGDIRDAASILRQFLAGRPPQDAAWIARYRPLAELYAADAKVLIDLETRAAAAKSPEDAAKVRELVDAARGELLTGTQQASDALDRIAERLDKPSTAESSP
jgi:eukaryotic-like serine/threonine-protein kinase